MNKVILIGNVTSDVEVKKTSTGKSVVQFTLAINEGEKTTFVDCRAWEKTADIIGQFVSKGQKLAVEGRIAVDSYEDKEGKKRKNIYVLVDRQEFVTPKKDKPVEVETKTYVDIKSDDLPFY